MPVAPGDHRPHEALVPGDVDHRQPPPVGEVEPRVAERDRDSPRLLLRQPVGVDAGQGLDETGLAVVDVAGGARAWQARGAAHPARAATTARDERVDLVVGDRAAVEQRVAPHGRRSRPAARRGAARSRARRRPRTAALGSSRQRQRAAAGPRDRLDDLAAVRPASRSARARTSRAARAASAATGISRSARCGIEVEEQRALERGERELVGPERPLERVAPQPPDELGAAADDPGLRARRAACRRRSVTRSAPAARLSGTSGSSSNATRLPEPRSSTSGSPWRPATPTSSRESRPLGEADRAEVRLVDAQQQRRCRGRSRPRSRRRACGSSCRPRRAARPSARARRGCGSRRRSRSARRARRPPRGPRRAPRARAAARRRCC